MSDQKDIFGDDLPPLPPTEPHEIAIDVPLGFDSDDGEVAPDLAVYFNELVGTESDNFDGPLAGALDLDVEDARIRVDEVRVELVETAGDDVTVSYVVSMSGSWGCSDTEYADDDHRVVSGERRGSVWVFTRHVSPEPLSPSEEL